MSIVSRLFGSAGDAQKGKSYVVGNAAEFNGAGYFGGKVTAGEVLICESSKTTDWPCPIFRRRDGVPQDAPHGTRELIKMTHKAKGNVSTYGLKAADGPR